MQGKKFYQLHATNASWCVYRKIEIHLREEMLSISVWKRLTQYTTYYLAKRYPILQFTPNGRHCRYLDACMIFTIYQKVPAVGAQD